MYFFKIFGSLGYNNPTRITKTELKMLKNKGIEWAGYKKNIKKGI